MNGKGIFSASNFWYLLQSGSADAARNMAVDAALLEAAPLFGRPVLRFYSWTQPAATFGYFQKYAEIERLTHLRPLVRRPTGGGLVPHDADWTYSVTVPPSHEWYELRAAESYQRIHEWIQAAFLSLGIPAELAASSHKAAPGQCFIGHEKSDVLWHGLKIAGAAQRRTRTGLLIQGSVQPPPGKNNRAEWEGAMLETGLVNRTPAWTDLRLTSELEGRISELAAKTYSQAEYNRRR